MFCAIPLSIVLFACGVMATTKNTLASTSPPKDLEPNGLIIEEHDEIILNHTSRQSSVESGDNYAVQPSEITSVRTLVHQAPSLPSYKIQVRLVPNGPGELAPEPEDVTDVLQEVAASSDPSVQRAFVELTEQIQEINERSSSEREVSHQPAQYFEERANYFNDYEDAPPAYDEVVQNSMQNNQN